MLFCNTFWVKCGDYAQNSDLLPTSRAEIKYLGSLINCSILLVTCSQNVYNPESCDFVVFKHLHLDLDSSNK